MHRSGLGEYFTTGRAESAYRVIRSRAIWGDRTPLCRRSVPRRRRERLRARSKGRSQAPAEISEAPKMTKPLLRRVDAVTFHVPDLDEGIAFYRDMLGHDLSWRNDNIGQAALALAESETEIVLTTEHGYEPNWLVASADEAAAAIESAGGKVLAAPFDIPVGRVAVVADPFGNVLVLVDLSKGRYDTDGEGNVTAVR